MPEQAVEAEPRVELLDPGAPVEADGAGAIEDEPTANGTTPEQLSQLIEAVLFVADGPVEEAALARALGVTRRQLAPALEALAEALRGRGLRLVRGPDGAQLVTAPQAASAIEQFLGIEAGRRLSTAALETLAIIAYRQPVTRAVVEAVRGVNSDGAIDTLRARGLIDVAGRAEGPGRPALFATTQRFLEYFGLERAGDLPALPAEVAERVLATEQGVQLAMGGDEPWVSAAMRAPTWHADEREPDAIEQGARGDAWDAAAPALSFARGPALPGSPSNARPPAGPGGPQPLPGAPRLL